MDFLGGLLGLSILALIGYGLFRLSLPVAYVGYKLLPTVAGFVLGVMIIQAGAPAFGIWVMIFGVIGNIVWSKFGRGSGRLK